MILIFSNTTNINLGGLEIFNEELENLFKHNEIEFYRVRSITNIKLIDYPYRLIRSIFHIFSNFKKIDFILVQYGNFLDILTLPFLKISLKSIRIIAHTGDSWKHIQNNITRALTNLILKIFVQKVYLISDEQRSFLTHRHLKKIHSIINKKYIENKTFTNIHEKYLLFLGRICSEKGIDDLIVVYSELNKTINLPKLKLAGPIKQSFRRHINKLLDTYKIHDQIVILNPIYNIDEKIKLIDGSSFLVYPSHSDAFPLSVIEAFARGKCILASSISETKYFIEFDKFLFIPEDRNDLRNKMKNLILNPNSFKNEINFMQRKSLKYANGNIINEILE